MSFSATFSQRRGILSRLSLPQLIHYPSVARGRQAPWLWGFATERTAGILACTLRMCDRAKHRKRGPDGAAVGRVVKKAGLVLFVSVSAPPLAAQPAMSLDPLTVTTASRTAQPLDRTLAAAEVLTRDDIERSQAGDLSELLRLVAGLDVVRSGPRGTQTSVFVRGANSNQVLVLIDGIRAAEASSGLFNFEHLPLSQIERIEIVRGPRAAWYGSDAIGGVIQIFTRRGKGLQARLGGGSFETREGELAAGGSAGDWDGRAAFGWTKSDGFSAQNENGFSFDPDNDGYRNTSVSFGGGRQLGSGRLDVTFLHADGATDFDQGTADSVNETAGVTYRFTTGKRAEHTARFGSARAKLANDFGFFTTAFKTLRFDGGWQSTLNWQPGLTLTGGVDVYREEAESAGEFDRSRRNIGVFSGLVWNGERHEVAASVRGDDDELFGTEATGQVMGGYEIASGLWLGGGYGRAFRAPNFNQLFSPGFGGQFAGNPDLMPETADEFEAVVRYRTAGHLFEARGFYNRFADLIDFSGVEFQAVNLSKARAHGLELRWHWENAAWRIAANGTIQSAVDRNARTPLLRRPDTKTAVTIDRTFSGGHQLGLEFFYNGKRPDFGGVVLKDYALVNLRAAIAIAPDWRLEARAENLFDDEFEPAFGFNGQDLSWFVHLTWRRE